MVVYRRETRRRPVLLIVAVLSIVLVTIDSRGNGAIDGVKDVARQALQPVQSVVDSAFDPVRNAAEGITEYGSVKDENAQLHRELDELRGRLQRRRAVGSEVGELEKLLDLPTIEDATGVAARVVSGSPGNFERTAVLNKGSGQGISVGQPVVAGNGLVGKITETTPSQSVVTLIDDPRIGVGVRLEHSNERGIAEGKSGERVMNLNFLSKLLGECKEAQSPDTCITKGELLFTSADSTGAKVVSVDKPQGDLEPTVVLEPLADLDDITYVKVLRWPEPKDG
jgi:rod shape-determining protein MreC